jgi:hypothetical protein
MAYDEALAERIRELVAGEHELTEKQMFGGLAFLIGGNMEGWLRVRSEHIQTRAQLAEWVTLGTTYARTLPSK